MRVLVSAVLAASLVAPAMAQDAWQPTPVIPAEAAPLKVLPANTEVVLRVNDVVTTAGKRYREGDTFGLSVARDVMHEGYVAIPRGSRAVGKITWLTNRGSFGKSGKMEIALQYVDVNGRRLPLEGTFREEGDGRTLETLVGVVAVGLVGASFITGKSATIPSGHELIGRTAEELAVRLAPRPAYARLPSRSFAPAAWPAKSLADAQPASTQLTSAQRNWGVVEVKSN